MGRFLKRLLTADSLADLLLGYMWKKNIISSENTRIVYISMKILSVTLHKYAIIHTTKAIMNLIIKCHSRNKF